MEKIKLPKKIKIAAWLMVTIGAIGILSLVFALIGLILIRFIEPSDHLLTTLTFLILGTIPLAIIIVSIFFIPGFFLLKRKKWAWWGAIITQSIIFIFNIIMVFILGEFTKWILINVILIVLFSLDRKDFFKIAS